MQQNKPTIEEILKYEEFLIDAVLKQSKIEQGKKELSQQYTMLALLFGLFGFEWID